LNTPEKSSINLSMKSAPVQGRIIRFIGSDESLDRDGDTISIDGWDVSAYMKNPVVIYGHDYSSLPIARTVSVTPDKRTRQLLFDIKFPSIEELSSNPATPSEHALRVDAIYNMAKAGILNTVSVGFRGIEYDATATGRNYKRQELMEISLVPIPANPNAVAIMRAAKVSDAVMKGVFTMGTNKIADPDKVPSVHDIIRALDKALNPNPNSNNGMKWVDDIYPISYPNGHAVIYEQGKYIMRDYTYSKTGVTISADGIEIEPTYAAKGFGKMTTKGNKKLSKESRAYLAERVDALAKMCDDLKGFIADDPEEGAEPGEEGDKAGNPVVGEEIGTNVNEQQPAKQYVIEIVEKAPTTSDK